ncbi:MAG: glycosyltransferase family 39 protein [Anaerolineae bacterium]|nr:glycosyltransferase family 39 protein [Anaerolineae bacterium]
MAGVDDKHGGQVGRGRTHHGIHNVWVLLPVVIILLLAAAARFDGVAERPVWTDEGWSAWAARDHDINVIWDKLAQDRHPPLYFMTLSAWWTLAGPSRLALRFLSIAGGLLTVAVAYRIGADWLGRRAARFGALLLAVLDIAVYYSQEIRHYGWLVLSVSLMSLFFLRYLRRPRAWTLVAYSLSITGMLYNLYLGLLVLGVQGVVGLLLWRGSRRDKAGLIAAWAGALVLYGPWLSVILSEQWRDFGPGIGGFPNSYDSTAGSLKTLSELLFGSQLALTLGLYAIGVWTITQQRDRWSTTWTARVYLVLGGGGLYLFMFAVNPWYGVLSARTLAFLTPLLMVVCGYGLSQLNRRVAGLFAALLVLFMLADTQTIQPHLDSHKAAAALAEQFAPGDLVVLETGWDDNAFLYELTLALPADHPAIIRTLPWIGEPTKAVPVVPQVQADITAHRRVWVVNWLQPSQVIPWLAEENKDYVTVMALETPVGAQYDDLYPYNKVVQAVLFERPNLDAPPLVYGDVLALRDSLLPETVKAGERLHVDLWWSAAETPALDYSVGVFLMDQDGVVKAEHNGPPGDTSTTLWVVDDVVFDRHTLHVPHDLAPGQYQVAVNVYWYGDLEPLAVNGQDYAVAGLVHTP